MGEQRTAVSDIEHQLAALSYAIAAAIALEDRQPHTSTVAEWRRLYERLKDLAPSRYE